MRQPTAHPRTAFWLFLEPPPRRRMAWGGRRGCDCDSVGSYRQQRTLLPLPGSFLWFPSGIRRWRRRRRRRQRRLSPRSSVPGSPAPCKTERPLAAPATPMSPAPVTARLPSPGRWRYVSSASGSGDGFWPKNPARLYGLFSLIQTHNRRRRSSAAARCSGQVACEDCRSVC